MDSTAQDKAHARQTVHVVRANRNVIAEPSFDLATPDQTNLHEKDGINLLPGWQDHAFPSPPAVAMLSTLTMNETQKN